MRKLAILALLVAGLAACGALCLGWILSTGSEVPTAAIAPGNPADQTVVAVQLPPNEPGALMPIPDHQPVSGATSTASECTTHVTFDDQCRLISVPDAPRSAQKGEKASLEGDLATQKPTLAPPVLWQPKENREVILVRVEADLVDGSRGVVE